MKVNVQGNVVTPEVQQWGEDSFRRHVAAFIKDHDIQHLEKAVSMSDDDAGYPARATFGRLTKTLIELFSGYDRPTAYLSQEQRENLELQIYAKCVELALKWTDEVLDVAKRGFRV